MKYFTKILLLFLVFSVAGCGSWPKAPKSDTSFFDAMLEQSQKARIQAMKERQQMIDRLTATPPKPISQPKTTLCSNTGSFLYCSQN